MKNALLFGGLLLVLATVNISVVRKESLITNGRVVLVELAPVDPRSLISGDYMRLDYALASNAEAAWPRDGRLVVRLDERGVAQYVRRDDGRALGTDEQLLQYRRRARRFRVGSDAFFFQEGHAARYANAKYGELRVDRSGGSVLVGLRDAALQPLR